jgi:hypothetical protein
MGKDFIPTQLDELDTFHGNFLTKLPIHNSSVGITPAQLTEATTKINACRTAYTTQVAAETNMAGLYQTAKAERNITNTMIRAFARQMKAHPNYTPAMGADLGIEVINTPINTDTMKPVLNLFLLPNSNVRVSFVKSIAKGVHIYTRRAGETEWTLLAFDTESPYIDTRENLGAGAEMREYKAVYVIGDVEVGLESDVATIAVP